MFDRPGFLTDVQDPPWARAAKSQGFEWGLIQVQNAGGVKPRSPQDLRSYGLKAGAWGVTYDWSDMARDARLLRDASAGYESVAMNFEHPISDLEAVTLINTFATDPRPKAVIVTVGILFDIQLPRFETAGWTIMTENYLNDQANLTPATSQDFALRAGMKDLSKLSYMLGWYSGALGRVPASKYISELRAVNAKASFSGYMIEQFEPLQATSELAAYGDYIRSIPSAPKPPEPQPQPDKYPWLKYRDSAKADLIEAVRLMRAANVTEKTISRSRIGIALSALESTDEELNTMRGLLGL